MSKIKGEDRYDSLDDYWNREVDLESQRDREDENLNYWEESLNKRKKEELKKEDRKEIQNVKGRIAIFKKFSNNRETWNPDEKIKKNTNYQRSILEKEIVDLKIKSKNARKKEIIEKYAREIKYKQDSLKHLENVLIPAPEKPLPKLPDKPIPLPPPEKPASRPPEKPASRPPEKPASRPPEKLASRPPEKPASRPPPEKPASRSPPEKPASRPPLEKPAPGFFEKYITPLYTTTKAEEKIDIKNFEKLNSIINEFNNRIIRVEQKIGNNNELKGELEKFQKIQTDLLSRTAEIENEQEKEENRRKAEDKKRNIEEAKRVSEEIKRSQEEIKRKNEARKRESTVVDDDKEKERQNAEDMRQRKEDVRQKSEDVRQQIEDSRQLNEDIRQKEFNNMIIFFKMAKNNVSNNSELIAEKLEELDDFPDKIGSWLKKILDDFTQKTNELQKKHEERLAKSVNLEEKELDRQNEEAKRMAAEEKRVDAEEKRVAAEAKRAGAEFKRKKNEINRIDEEEKRFSQEVKRTANEELRKRNNKIIIENEKERIQNEKNRVYFEKLRVNAEIERQRLFDEGIKSLNEKINSSEQKIIERDTSVTELHDKMKKLENDLEKVKNDINKNPTPQLTEKRSQIEEDLKIAADNYFDVLNERIITEERKSKERDFAFQENLKLLEEQKNEWFNLQTFKEPLVDFMQKPIKFFESYFTNEENTLDWVENEKLREATEENLKNIETEKTPSTYRNALLDGISSMEDKMLSENWEKLIFEEDREKFFWLQKFEKIKPFFEKNKIYFSADDKNLYDFFKENVTDNFTPKTEELNGFTYKNKKIFRRKKDGSFSPFDSPELKEFLSQLNSLNKSANSIITENLTIFTDTRVNKEFARDYIENLREEQKELVRNTNDEGEYFEMEEFNEIEKEIAQIQNNKKFKIRPKVWAKSAGWRLFRIIRYIKNTFWRHKLKVIGVIIGMISSSISAVVFTKQIDRASNYVKNLGNDIMNQSKNILDKLNGFKIPAMLVGFFGTILYYFGDGILIASNVIFTPIAWAFTLLTPLFVGVIIGFAYKLTNLGKYQGINLTAFSYFLNNEYPPDDLLKYLAEENEMTLKEYKEKYVTKDELYDNFFAKLSSYIIYTLGKGLEITSEGAESLLDWLTYFSKIIIGVLIFFIILYIINKWRS